MIGRSGTPVRGTLLEIDRCAYCSMDSDTRHFDVAKFDMWTRATFEKFFAGAQKVRGIEPV